MPQAWHEPQPALTAERGKAAGYGAVALQDALRGVGEHIAEKRRQQGPGSGLAIGIQVLNRPERVLPVLDQFRARVPPVQLDFVDGRVFRRAVRGRRGGFRVPDGARYRVDLLEQLVGAGFLTADYRGAGNQVAARAALRRLRNLGFHAQDFVVEGRARSRVGRPADDVDRQVRAAELPPVRVLLGPDPDQLAGGQRIYPGRAVDHDGENHDGDGPRDEIGIIGAGDQAVGDHQVRGADAGRASAVLQVRGGAHAADRAAARVGLYDRGRALLPVPPRDAGDGRGERRGAGDHQGARHALRRRRRSGREGADDHGDENRRDKGHQREPRPGERVEPFSPGRDLPDEPAAPDRAPDVRAAVDARPAVIPRPGQQYEQPDPVLSLQLDPGELKSLLALADLDALGVRERQPGSPVRSGPGAPGAPGGPSIPAARLLVAGQQSVRYVVG